MESSMKDKFRHHHRLDEKEQLDLWSTCTFVLDASVLLNIYRYEDVTREDLFRVLVGLGTRAWVPFQAAREFYRNRINVIREQRQKYVELTKALDGSLNELRGGNFSKSAFLGMNDIEGVLRPAIEQAKRQIKERRDKHPDLLRDDIYLERLSSIVGMNIGAEPDKAWFDKSCDVAQTRIDAKQPPGYRDAQKSTPDRYGDVFIWFELLEHAAAIKTPILFVSDDDKEDWWQIIEGQKLGPRPELREEIRTRAGVEFHIANPAYFLERVGQQLNVPVAQSSVEDASNVAAENRETIFQRKLRQVLQAKQIETTIGIRSRTEFAEIHRTAEQAVANWILSQKDGSVIEPLALIGFDFLLRESDGRRTAIQVLPHRFSDVGTLIKPMREMFVRAFYEIHKGSFDDLKVFIVTSSRENSKEVAERLAGRSPEPAYEISIGYLPLDQEYEEFARLNNSSQ